MSDRRESRNERVAEWLRQLCNAFGPDEGTEFTQAAWASIRRGLLDAASLLSENGQSWGCDKCGGAGWINKPESAHGWAWCDCAHSANARAVAAPCPDGQPCLATTTGCLPGQCNRRNYPTMLVERVAKALCRHAYPSRSLDEALSPTNQLWQRLIPEAEIAVAAIVGSSDSCSTNTPEVPKRG